MLAWIRMMHMMWKEGMDLMCDLELEGTELLTGLDERALLAAGISIGPTY